MAVMAIKQYFVLELVLNNQCKVLDNLFLTLLRLVRQIDECQSFNTSIHINSILFV